MNIKTSALILTSIITIARADNLQSQLMKIAQQEARIANIGDNKYMMLYGIDNPIAIIKRWTQIEQRPRLNEQQITKINILEQQKQEILKKQYHERSAF